MPKNRFHKRKIKRMLPEYIILKMIIAQMNKINKSSNFWKFDCFIMVINLEARLFLEEI
jgi:hypothetical protein